MLRILVIGLVFASLLTPEIAGTTQNYSIQFNTYFIRGTNQNQTLQIAVDGKIVATGSFLGSGALSASVALDDSSHHNVTAWPHSHHPPGNEDPDEADFALYGGTLSVNGATCATSNDVWIYNPLSCNLPTAQPVPEFYNASVSLPLVLLVLVSAMVLTRKTRFQGPPQPTDR